MALVAITLKIMPVSPSVDMAKLKSDAEKIIKKLDAYVHSVKEEPIAFGLNALICIVGWKEGNDPDTLEQELGKIKDVQSVEVTDVRRAIG